MTTEDARARYIRAERAQRAALRAGLTGLQLEAFEAQAADAYARFITVSSGEASTYIRGNRTA